MLSFLARNTIAGGFLIVIGGAAVLSAAAGLLLRSRSKWTALVALILAALCVGAAGLQRIALLNAAAAVRGAAGLAATDRARIVATDLADAHYVILLGMSAAALALVIAACSALLAPSLDERSKRESR